MTVPNAIFPSITCARGPVIIFNDVKVGVGPSQRLPPRAWKRPEAAEIVMPVTFDALDSKDCLHGEIL